MNKAQIISYIQEIIHFLRIQNYHEGCMRFRVLIQEMQDEPDVRNELLAEDSPIKEAMERMLLALEEDDVILLADLLEEVLLPLIKELIVPLESIECDDYQVEITSSGYWTVKHLPSNLYLHSNGNPMEEARILVDSCFDPHKESYAVWGCGLGYHVARLFEAARSAVSIVVFDENKEIFELAMESGILEQIPQEQITYIADPTGEAFSQFVSENDAGILLHFPSIKAIQNKALKDALHEFFAGLNSVIHYKNELAVNFRSNQQNCPKNVDELEVVFKDKETVLVAAGPSLDNSLDFLREAAGKKVIVAVTTVLKKLLEQGIVPDYAVVMDSQKRTLGHIAGIENSTVPLIVDSTAYWEFAKEYAGEKYIAYQKGYKDAEDCAADCGRRTYETGGSVITLALDIMLQLGAKEISLVGVDLAYPEGVSHADGTMDQTKRNVSGMEQVKAVCGGMVYADSLFIGYRKWVERKIRDYPEVDFYNLSDCGAKISGAKVMNVESGNAVTSKEISVVIPCYNVEKYIDECVNSLVNQTFGIERMELIFVDDASTDSTFEKLCAWEQMYPDSIKVIRFVENCRQGAARNEGMMHATGTYLGFVDSDDYPAPDMFQMMYDFYQKEDVDCVICARYDDYEDGKQTVIGPLEDGIMDLSSQKYPGVMINTRAPGGVYQRLYKREWLESLDVWFPEKLTYEDNFFGGIINYYLKRIGLIKTPLYHYRINNVSTVQKKNSMHHLDRLTIELMKVEELINRGLYETYRENIEFEFLHLYFANTIVMLVNKFEELPDGVILQMQQTVKKLFPEWRKNPLLQIHKNVASMCQLIDCHFVKGDKKELLLAYAYATERKNQEICMVNEESESKELSKKNIGDNMDNIKDSIFYMSVLYEKSKDINIIYTILECIKDNRIDCLIMDNIREQMLDELFTRADDTLTYEEERELQNILINKWEREYGEFVNYIPVEQRNKNAILVTTNQFLGLQHAPTKVVVAIIKSLVEAGFQVYLLVNYTYFDAKLLGELLCGYRPLNAREDLYGKGIFKFDSFEFPVLQVNYARDTQQAISDVRDYIEEIKPELVWHIGGTSFISDMIGRCSTMIATKCTDGYAVSEAPILASYMASNSKYVKDSLAYIDKNLQKATQFIAHSISSFEKKDVIREEYCLPENKYLLCLVGNRLNDEVDTKFLQWMKEIVDYSKDFMFVTVGIADELWKDSEYKDRIIHLGYQNELLDVLTCMNLFINPPRKGGGGGAVIALAAGIPVLTLDYCDVANVVPRDFVVASLEEMKERTIQCRDNKEYYKLMCDKGREKFAERMSQYENGESGQSILKLVLDARVL